MKTIETIRVGIGPLIRMKFKNWFNKNWDSLKKFLKSNKFLDFKDFLFGAIGYGVLVNYMLWAIWHIPFKWYSFPAFGILYYFITNEFPLWFLKLKSRR